MLTKHLTKKEIKASTTTVKIENTEYIKHTRIMAE